jgi:DNA primase
MGSDIERIKERLGIAEIVSGYVKLEKSGASLKGRCPFHNEKTPSFFVSPARQSYYCFGCGQKGDIFTFVEAMEGVSFKEALKSLAEKAGVELKGAAVSREAKSEKDRLRQALDAAAEFFVKKLEEHPEAKQYLLSRGLSEETIRAWKLGYAPAEWRSLYNHLLPMGFDATVLIKAGLVKPVTGAAKEPYDVFRDRLIFPLFDHNGEVVAFSGRALAKETEPKYLNTPETVLFAKHELLYGLDRAKGEIRRQNYAVLVEGQVDLVLSHQAGVANAVASSGTAFTAAHLERLKKLSPRILLAFDGDKAGEAAGEKASALALSLGLEVKVAKLPEGRDPADLIKENPDGWKHALREAKPAIEAVLDRILESEKDRRKALKLVESKLLPLLALLNSSIERSHFVSLVAKRTGVKEEMIWEDLRKHADATRRNALSPSGLGVRSTPPVGVRDVSPSEHPLHSKKEKIQERLTEVRTWLKELPEKSPEVKELEKEESELLGHLTQEELKEELADLSVALAAAETSKDDEAVSELSGKIQEVLKRVRGVEEGRNVL